MSIILEDFLKLSVFLIFLLYGTQIASSQAQRIKVLDSSIKNLVDTINSFQMSMVELTQVVGVTTEINTLSVINSVIRDYQHLEEQTQYKYHLHYVDGFNLSSKAGDIAFVDPCGNGPGIDEVILITTAGKFLTNYGELIMLKEGYRYKTADVQVCSFVYTENGLEDFSYE